MYVMAEDKMSADRGKAVEAALLNIEKKFGKGSIMKLSARPVSDVAAISTTSLSLDAAIGVGGVPRGRIIEIFGPESSGKTTLALHIVSEAQKAGGVAAYIDAEHAMDAEYAGKLGVNVDELLISQPDSGEQALEIAEALVRSNGVDVIVVDSVAALVPRAELDGDMGDSLPGLHARLMSQALRKLAATVSQTNTCFIFINQIREKIDVMFGEGISREGDVVDLGVANKVVEKSGAWFSYKGERLGQGRENAKQTLRDNPELLQRIETEVRTALGIPVSNTTD